MSAVPRRQIAALVAAWLTIDLFGRTRRSPGEGTGSLTTAVFTQGFLSYLFAALAFEEVATVPFLAGTLAVVAGFTSLALLGEMQDRLGHAADRDLVLASPIRGATLAVARGCHLATFLVLFGAGLALAPAILAGFKTGNPLMVPAYVGAALLLGLTVAAAIQLPLALAGKLLGPERASALAALLRAVLLGAGFLAVLLGFRAMHGSPERFPGGLPLLRAMPPYWLARVLDGASLRESWWWLGLGLPAAVATALAGVAVIPDRMRAASRRRGRAGDVVVSWLTRQPRERGMLAFTVAMLVRERSFRLRALPLLGLPAALIVLGLRGETDPDRAALFLAVVHNLPVAYLPFLLFFVPHAEDWRAAWLVETSLGDPRPHSRRAVARSFALAMVPVQILLFGIDVTIRPGVAAVLTSALALGIVWLLLPLLCARLENAFARAPDELGAPAEIGGPAMVGIGVTLAAVGLETAPAGVRMAAAAAMLVAGAVLLLRTPKARPT